MTPARFRPVLGALVVPLATALAVAGTAYPADAAPARGPAAPARYVVQLAPAAGAARTAADLRRSGLTVTATYTRVFDGFAAMLTPDQVGRLQRDRRVLAVRPDQAVHAAATEAGPTWGLDRIDQRATAGDRRYVYRSTGRGVRAYVIDTGIRTTHREFGGRATSGYDFVDGDRTAQDCNGHGTHVAGTLGGRRYGVAKGVSLVALRVLDCSGDGYESDVVAALEWVLAHRGRAQAVVNLSLASDPSPVMDAAIESTVRAGVPVVVAAGNDGADACRTSPARAPQAITVAASTRTDRRAEFSNYGSCVDLYAPGEEIRSAWADSDSSVAESDGTSMAAPHVAGAVARYLQDRPGSTPAQVRRGVLAVTGKRIGGSHSWPNRLLFVRSGAPSVPTRTTAATRTGSPHAIALRWGAPTHVYGSAVTGYVVSRTGVDARGRAFPATTVPASARSYVFRGLAHRKPYRVTVRASNGVGQGEATGRTVTTR